MSINIVLATVYIMCCIKYVVRERPITMGSVFCVLPSRTHVILTGH